MFFKNPYENYKVRYYAIGEYGSQFQRPHYHVLLFNVPTELIRIMAEKIWKKGNVHIGRVERKSIGYVAGYLQFADKKRALS